MFLYNDKVKERNNNMSKSYIKPPVVEVFSEFQFAPNPHQPLDITVIGLFYDKIKNNFPKKQPQIGVGVPFSPTKPLQMGEMQPPQAGLSLAINQRVQFFRQDRSALLQATPDTLTVNHLTPYTSWDEFKPVILDNFEIFREIINPKGFKRIALAYINRLDFNEWPAELKNCFNFYFTLPKGLSNVPPVAFTSSVEIPYEDGRNNLGVTLQTIPPERPNLFSCMLNLNYHTSRPESAENVHLNNVGEWIQTAHDIVVGAFEQCLTSECKARFGGIK